MTPHAVGSGAARSKSSVERKTPTSVPSKVSGINPRAHVVKSPLVDAPAIQSQGSELCSKIKDQCNSDDCNSYGHGTRPAAVFFDTSVSEAAFAGGSVVIHGKRGLLNHRAVVMITQSEAPDQQAH